jgi:hypothetical protein
MEDGHQMGLRGRENCRYRRFQGKLEYPKSADGWVEGCISILKNGANLDTKQVN